MSVERAVAQPDRRLRRGNVYVLAAVAAAALCAASNAFARTGADTPGDAAIVSVYPTEQPRGLMVTTGGWVYCAQLRALAARTEYTLVCGRYFKDGYTDPSHRGDRH